MSDSLATRKVIGVLVPYFNSIVEPELADLRPDGVSNQTARFSLDEGVREDILAAAEKLASCGPEAFLIALSTEMFPGGLELLADGAEALRSRVGLPVCTASHATHDAVRALGAERIALVTPFDEAANELVRTTYEALGFSVAAIEGLGCQAYDRIAHVQPGDVIEAFARADRDDVDALVQIGTGLAVLHLVERLEREHGKPVVACNAATYWRALRMTGIDDRMSGYGRLLAHH